MRDEILSSIITRLMDEYGTVKNENIAGHAFVKFFEKDVPGYINSLDFLDVNRYLVSASVGKGNWANVPWICIFRKTITNTPTEGVYIAYFLSTDGENVFLALNQGCTKLKNEYGNKKAVAIMRKHSENVRARIIHDGFSADDDMELGDRLSELAKFYKYGTIFYKAYRKSLVPSEEELQSDLMKMLEIYEDYIAHFVSGESHKKESGESNKMEEEVVMSTDNTLDNIKSYISAKGFRFESDLISNFYLSLKSKPFVILAGTSGTGKTKLVKLFAEAVGATISNGRYKMVSVRPDWSDSSDLFGHVDLHGHFIPGAIINFIKNATDNPQFPYFLCFDEMNLARVEYYLSDILSIIETRQLSSNGHVVSEPLIERTYYGTDDDAVKKYGELSFPDNLYIIGTVNMDETTFPFSKKVLDRANTIEFSYVDLLLHKEDVAIDDKRDMNLSNDFFKADYLLLDHCGDDDLIAEYCVELNNINKILEDANAHVGYRVRDEIIFYLLYNKKSDLLPIDVAFDYQILQKVLPRIQGSNSMVNDLLINLFKYCVGDYRGIQSGNEDTLSQMELALQSTNCKYKKSAQKILFMIRRYLQDGFTSYWL